MRTPNIPYLRLPMAEVLLFQGAPQRVLAFLARV
jgi:hypothetical protein